MLRLNNVKARTAMNVRVSVFVIYVEAIIYFLLYICKTVPLRLLLLRNPITGTLGNTLLCSLLGVNNRCSYSIIALTF